MGVISTKELIDKFFAATFDETTIQKTKSQVDRPELYEYEVSIGKDLIDMNPDELDEMIQSFGNRNYKGKNGGLSPASRRKIVQLLRRIFDFYIEKYQPIWNPFRDKRFSGIGMDIRIAKSSGPFTWDNVENAIRLVRSNYDEVQAKYIECIILLFYHGFSEPKEIAELTEDMINFKRKEVRLTGRTVKLSDRCFELLQYIHDTKEIRTPRGVYVAVSWRNSYLKFFTRPADADYYDQRDIKKLCDYISSKISTDVARRFNLEISYYKLFMLGFYDYIVSKHGEEETRAMIESKNDSEVARELELLASQYGTSFSNCTIIKSNLIPFLR